MRFPARQENWTPAHLACAYGNSGLFRVLVERGALLEAQTKVIFQATCSLFKSHGNIGSI